LRYWWFNTDGSLVAPMGGQNIPGRYRGQINSTSPEQIYAQVRRYRNSYPDKAIIHEYEASAQGTWAFLMAGGSMLVRRLEYFDSSDPKRYTQPPDTDDIKPLYDFINTHLAASLPLMKPLDLVSGDSPSCWCIGQPGTNYLCYSMQGDKLKIDLRDCKGRFEATWVNPRNGNFIPLTSADIFEVGEICSVNTPDNMDWALWIRAVE